MKNRILFISLFALSFLVSGPLFAQKGKKTKTKESGVKVPKSSIYELQGPFCNGISKVRMNKKWGYIKKDGSTLVKPKYTEAESFEDGVARVRNIKGWGLIDTTGKEILIPAFIYISEFVEGKAKVVMIGGQFTYINKKGENIGR